MAGLINSVLIKFTFISDSIDTQQDGLMFDNLGFCISANSHNLYQLNNLKVFPNPTTDGVLKIYLGGLSNNSNIYIHDAIGKLIHFETIGDNNGSVFQKQINISQFNPGLYFVTLEELEQSNTKKIIFN